MGRYRLGFAWLVSGGQARELDRDQDGRITSDDFLLLEEKCFGSALEVNALPPLSICPLISGPVEWSIGSAASMRSNIRDNMIRWITTREKERL